MSFWDNVKKLAQPYADEDDYDDEDYADDYEEETPEPAPARTARPRRTPPFSTASDSSDYASSSDTSAPSSASTASAGFSGQVVNLGGNRQEVVLFHPANFNDTSKAADDLRNRKAVIVNMENVDKAMARRVVDFLSGCAYALDGKVKKIAQSTYLFCPHNVDVVGDLENLQSEVESYL